MSAPPDPPAEEFFRSSMIRCDLVMRIKWNDNSVSRLCSAFGGIRIASDSVEGIDNAYYPGTPALLEVPALRQLINGVADAIELSLSGLWGELADLLDEDIPLAKGAIIDIGRVYYDANWQQLGATRWGWNGTGGAVTSERKGARFSESGDMTPETRTVKLSATTQTVRRSGSALSYWSSPQHRLDHPDDQFFDLINKLNVGYIKAFPVF